MLSEPVWAPQTFVSEIRQNCTRFSVAREGTEVREWDSRSSASNTCDRNASGACVCRCSIRATRRFEVTHGSHYFFVGRTLAYVLSEKQKCMSKSPTEAELIGLSDNLGLVELFKEFVEFLVGREIEIPIVYQDCKAVIS